MKVNERNKVIVSVSAIAGLLLLLSIAWAGILEPSGPPGPTMKTLDEIEPRIPINDDTAPGDTFYKHIISSPGSYYLTSNVNTSRSGISVDVNDVTIDLAGFALVGPGLKGNYGIYMGKRRNVEIHNGTVRNFPYGIYCGSSVSQNYRIINVRSVSNLRHGIYLYGNNHLVKDCTVSDNGHSYTSNVYGIRVGHGSTVTGNTVSNNGYLATGDYVYGIYTQSGCTVTGNTAHRNGFYAAGTGYGIYLEGSSLVDQNTATANGAFAGSGINMNNPDTNPCTFGTNHAP